MYQSMDNNNNGVDIFEKKNNSIISRMKRSLSTSNRPQTPGPLKISPVNQYTNKNSLDVAFQRALSPVPLQSPTFSSIKSSQSSPYFNTSPTAHLSYETFATQSNSNLSMNSIPSIHTNSKRLSFHDVLNKKISEQDKSIKSKQIPIEDEPILESPNLEKEEDEVYAPFSAMYWSTPNLFGIKPPSLRSHASVVFEDRMYVYGGTNRSICSDVLYIYQLDTSSWFKPRVFGTAPPPCRGHSLVVNPKTGKIYLFGGGDGQSYYHDTYELDTNTMCWSRLKTTGDTPSERRAHTTILWNDALYVFGGGDGSRVLNDLYRLDLKKKVWSRVQTQGHQPTCRGYHTGTLVGKKMVIYGGSDGKECFGGGVHILDLESYCWFPIQLDEQLPRLSHSALCIGSYLFIVAGHDGSRYCNDVFMLNLVNMCWETKRVYGQAPSPRGYHTTVLYDSRIILFGGYNGSTFSNDVHLLDLSSYAYLPQIVNFTIDTS